MSLLIAFVCSLINLTPNRLEVIETVYPDLDAAARDNFSKCLEYKWAQKWIALSEIELENKLRAFGEILLQDQIGIISYKDQIYPPELKLLADYPLALYYQGNLDLLENQAKITIVGSRNIQIYTKQVLEQTLLPIIKQLTTVSGLALGVDALVHNLSTQNQGATIAIIGSGLDERSFYPTQNLTLKDKILNTGGLILSEYAPGTRPTIYSFPRRNRLLAALSRTTWVAQASAKSGSLITATIALELGQTVATTPANVLDSSYQGNLQLLKNGASLIADGEDLMGLLNLSTHFLSSRTITPDPVFSSPEQKVIFEALQLEPQELDTLQQNTNLPLQVINSNLTLLEISGLATSIGNNQWIRC